MADKIDSQINQTYIYHILLISNNKTLGSITDKNIITLMHVNTGHAQHNQPGLLLISQSKTQKYLSPNKYPVMPQILYIKWELLLTSFTQMSTSISLVLSKASHCSLTAQYINTCE